MPVQRQRDTTSDPPKWRYVGRCGACHYWTLPFAKWRWARHALDHHIEKVHG
jgi:hypothetical protein